MLNTCHFLLDNGLPCRAPALHNGQYCRHHTPEALAGRQASLAPDLSATQAETEPQGSDEDMPPAHLRAYWRMHHRVIAESHDDEQCQDIFDMIIMALLERAISPRSAGKLLLAVLDRRKFLAHLAQEAAYRTLEERARIHRRQMAEGGIADNQPLLEALKNTVFSAPAHNPPAPHPFGGLENYPPDR